MTPRDLELAYRLHARREKIPASARCAECNGLGLEPDDALLQPDLFERQLVVLQGFGVSVVGPLKLAGFVCVCIPCHGTGRDRRAA